jgi:NAD(P)-dependent dehydrogenase (short-subunit alcohol dehydrogenase family)
MDVRDKVVVISGATGVLGQAAARMFAENGAQLALLSNDLEKLRSIQAELGLPGERIMAGVYDLRLAEQAQQAAAAVNAKFGRADILINVVGGWMGGKPVFEAPAADTVEMLNQHLWTTYNLIQGFVPGMAQRGWGRVMVVSSTVVRRPTGMNVSYMIGKSAQEALVLTLASELQDTGVTANIIRVRAIDSNRERLSQPSAKNKNWALPEEIATAMLYLAGEEAGLVNGAILPLAGAGS